MKKSKYEELTERQKSILVSTGISLLIFGIVSYYLPPINATRNLDLEGKLISTKEEQSVRIEIPCLCLTFGLLSTFVGVNGFKFSKLSLSISKNDISAAEADTLGKFNVAKENDDLSEIKEVDIPLEEDKQGSIDPINNYIQTVTVENHAEELYKYADTPPKIINLVIDNWDSSWGSKPLNPEAEFDFATRRPGQGNKPWTIKFKDSNAIRISFGGQGKKTPTVAPADPNPSDT